MMRIKALQNTFQQYLMATEHDASVLAQITPVANNNMAERLNIYHHAYRSRIREALSNQFPNLAKLLGAEVFNQYMDDFIAHYPSTHRNMRWLGDKLSDFLQASVPDKPLHSDMANFEWHLGLAFDSPDTPCLTIQDLSAFTPEQWGDLSFEWHPSAYLGIAQTNIIGIWMQLETNVGSEIHLTIEPSFYLVWRKSLVSQFKSLSSIEADAIAYMMQNHTFGELCAYLTGHMDEESVVPYVAGLLSQWIQEEMLVSVELKTGMHD